MKNVLDQVYSSREAADIWGLSENTVTQWCNRGTLEEGEFRQSSKVWLVTREGMERQTAVDYKEAIERKNKREWEKMMNEKIKLWESELQHELKNFEFIMERNCGINTAHSQSSWYGLDTISITENTLNDDRVFYTVNVESNRELIKIGKSRDAIIDALTNVTTTGDYDLIAVFEKKSEAIEFIKREYPEINIEEELGEECDYCGGVASVCSKPSGNMSST